MLAPAPLPIPSPPLASAPVQELLQHFAAVLPWLSDGFGLVQTGVDKTGKHKIPQLYLQDGSLFSIDVYPDEKMKALCWFERDGTSTIEWDDATHLGGEWTHRLGLVMWLNLKLIDPAKPYDFTDELLTDFLTNGLLNSPLGVHLSFEEVEQRNERIFQRYNFPTERQQLLMHPFSGFRVPFTVTQKFDRCAPAFTLGFEDEGPFLLAGGSFIAAKDYYLLARK